MENPKKNPSHILNAMYGMVILTTNKYFRIGVILFMLLGGFLNGLPLAQAQLCPTTCGTNAGNYCYNTVSLVCKPLGAAANCPKAEPTACTIVKSTNAGSNTVICGVIGVYNTVVTVIFVLGIMLMILGGALYGGSQLLPGSSKGTIQGYGMGMVLGGVIALIIGILAPFILSVLTGYSSSTVTGAANTFAGGCPA